jgi:hypothetical protein
VNQGGTFVGSKSGFSKGIHDLEKCSLRTVVLYICILIRSMLLLSVE